MENKTSPLEFTIKGIIDIVFRYKLIIIITFFTITLFAFIGLQFKTPIYDANVKMLIRGQSVTAAETYVPIGSYAIRSTQAEIVQSYPVLKRAAIALNLPNRPLDYEAHYSSKLKKLLIQYRAEKIKKELRKYRPRELEEIKLDGAIKSLKSRLTVSLLPGTDIIVINVTGFTPEEAIEAANVISRSYTIFDQMQQLAEIRIRYGEYHPTVQQLKDNINYTTENLSGETLPDIQAIGTASVKIIEQAISDNRPIGKAKRIYLALALCFAAFMGFGLAFVYGVFIDQTLKTPQGIASHLGIACIGSIPKKNKKETYLITEESPLSQYTEYYEDLAEQLYIFLKTQRLESALITSPSYNENHKYIVPNLGYFLSQILGHSTLLIDANFHDPHFQKIYNLQTNNSESHNMELHKTSDELTNNKNSENASSFISHHLSQNLISKINDGPDILLTDKFPQKLSTVHKRIDLKTIINKLQKAYDVILIDATSINNMRDISSISECSDGTVFIIDEGKLQRQMMKNSLPVLRKKDIKIIGSILNNRTFPIPELVYKRFKYFID